MALADLDGDTVPDLVTANRGSNDVNVLLGNGDGTLGAATGFTAGAQPVSVAVADLDGDTVPDLVTANLGSNDVSVLIGRGDGIFQAAVSFAADLGPLDVAAVDLDGDTVPDLVTAGGGGASVLLGNGDATLEAAVSFPAGAGSQSVAVADFDGDTVPDIVTANAGGDVGVLLGNGDGTFQPAAFFAAGNWPSSVAVADLDGDTVPDLVTANAGLLTVGLDFAFLGRDVTVLLNLSDPVRRPEIDIRPWSDPNFILPFSRLIIPVALLGSETFDVLEADASTLAFGPNGAAPIFDLTNFWVLRFSRWDVNGDGHVDLLSSYRTEETGIAMGETEACLTGEMVDGISMRGCDAIVTVLGCGLGFELVFVLPPLVWLRQRRRRNARA